MFRPSWQAMLSLYGILVLDMAVGEVEKVAGLYPVVVEKNVNEFKCFLYLFLFDKMQYVANAFLVQYVSTGSCCGDSTANNNLVT